MASILDSSVFQLFVALLYHGKHWFISYSSYERPLICLSDVTLVGPSFIILESKGFEK